MNPNEKSCSEYQHSQGKQSQYRSPMTKGEQITTKKNFRVPSNGYSKILQSFNKRIKDLYSLGEQNAQVPGTNNQLIVNPFTLDTGFIESRTQQKVKNEPKQLIAKQICYQGMIQVDPFLLQLGTQLDQQHQRQKQAILQQTFIRRYDELIQRQKEFQGYKMCKETQINNFHELISELRGEKQNIEAKNNQLNEQLGKVRESHTIIISELNKEHSLEREKLDTKISELSQVLRDKDSEFNKLHTVTIAGLESRLDQQIAENLHLKALVQGHVQKLKSKDEQLFCVDTKKLQLIQTLQKSLSHSQHQKVKISQDLQRVCEELHSLKQTHASTKQQLKQLTFDYDIKLNELQRAKESLTQSQENNQMQIYEHKIKYLQEIKEKNAIIEQFQQSQERNGVISCEYTQIKQRVYALQAQVQENEQRMKTQRVLYLETCAQYEAQVSDLKLKLSQSESILQEIELKMQSIAQQRQLSVNSYTQHIAKLEKFITHHTALSSKLQTDCNQLRTFKQHKLEEFQNSKQSFQLIIDQLKTQLEKAKQIIKSKNQQINELRKANHSIKRELRDMKCDRCQLENDLNETKQKYDISLQEKQQKYQEIKDQFLVFKQQNFKEFAEKDQKIIELTQKNSENTKNLNTKSEHICNLQLEITSLAKKLKQHQIEMAQLRGQLKQTLSKLTQSESSHREELILLKKELQDQISAFIKDHQHNLQAIHLYYQSKIDSKDQQYAQLNQEHISAHKQVQNMTQLLIQIRNETTSLNSLNISLKTEIQQLKCQLTQSHLQQTIWQQKYQTEHQLILETIQKRSHPLQQKDQNKPNELASKDSNKQSKILQAKHLKIIQTMKLQIMELTLYFKEKSAHEQELRKILQHENQELTSRLFQLSNEVLPSSQR